ncbi:DUF4440 domain-containing protein [Alteromonas facilis]|uniref:nuclear transport factor 2 family protein n=1 Tax=Alteromonas facilis TaxID=2048004 RepID=UPI000C285972|nr:DUF4440 domain-containing protein [Alteromonas facilis]
MEFEIIRNLELELNDPAIRKDKQRLAALISEDFEEIGKSGRKFTKSDIINELVNEEPVAFSTHDFNFIVLAEDCILVKYQTTIDQQSAYRCSIWKRVNNNWQIKYHQGTSIKHAM